MTGLAARRCSMRLLHRACGSARRRGWVRRFRGTSRRSAPASPPVPAARNSRRRNRPPRCARRPIPVPARHVPAPAPTASPRTPPRRQAARPACHAPADCRPAGSRTPFSGAAPVCRIRSRARTAGAGSCNAGLQCRPQKTRWRAWQGPGPLSARRSSHCCRRARGSCVQAAARIPARRRAPCACCPLH